MKNEGAPLVEVTKMIKVKYRKGDGEFEPVRDVIAYYSIEGELLFEKDPYMCMKTENRGDEE